MKEKLIELSKEKGFKSVVKITSLYQIRYIYEGSDDVVDDYTGIIYYLWLCELQKYLRENHNINIFIHTFKNVENLKLASMEIGVKYYCWDIFEHPNLCSGESYIKFEQALEKGLFEALKLIKL